MRNVYRISISGLNIDRLINFIKSNYSVYNISRHSYTDLEFDITYDSYYKLLSKIDLTSYDVNIIKVCGYKQLLQFLKKNIAGIISVILMISSAFYLSTRLLKINIYGASDSVRNEIVNYLEESNISIMSSRNISIDNLEKNLLENIDAISMVSTVIKGNVLVVNVKEKLPDIVQDFADVIAPCNLIIESIECYQGTVMHRAGDILSKGEVIVGAYTISGENNIPIEPIYDIKYSTYITGSVEFQTITKNLVRTGHKIINSCYNICGLEILKSNKSCDYELYEEENKNISLFHNLFIPIFVNKDIYYELEEVTITHDFDAEKERLFLESKAIAESKLLRGMTIKNTTQNIVDTPHKKVIQTNLEVEGILTND